VRLSEKLIIMLDMECVPRADVPTIEQAIALAKRYEDAATGECVEAGSMPGLEGDPFVGIIIESTPGELKRGPSIVYKRVRILLDTEGV
jgi:hypothetical protein